MSKILQYNRDVLEKIASDESQEIIFHAPIHEKTEEIAICRLEGLHYNEQNGKIVYPPIDGVVSRVDIEVSYDRAGSSNSGFWIPKMDFKVERPQKEDSWDDDLPFGSYMGDVVFRDSLNQFLFFQVNNNDQELR